MHENDMQLPYDRCVKIDQEIDTLLEEEKKKQQKQVTLEHMYILKLKQKFLMIVQL